VLSRHILAVNSVLKAYGIANEVGIVKEPQKAS
jgi:hypothetical protein